MPLVSALTKSLQVKIVYYGPGLSGKTTNLEKLATMLDKERVGELMSLDTSGDRTLFFDWMPVELGKIRGFDVKIQLYTVPGQIRYDRTRQQVLRGVDGIVFVADSQRDAMEQNIFSFKNLRDNLALSGRDLEEIPVVIQCNKKDLPNTVTTREMALALHAEHLPFVEASAQTGQGVLETLRLITRLTMKHVQAYLDPSQAKNLPSSQEALDGDTLLSSLLTSEAVLKEHKEAEKDASASSTPATTPEAGPVPPAQPPAPPAGMGGPVPSPEEVDRADSAELTPVVEIKEELVSARPAEMEIEAEPPDAPPEPTTTVSGEMQITPDPTADGFATATQAEPAIVMEQPAAPASSFALPSPDSAPAPAVPPETSGVPAPAKMPETPETPAAPAVSPDAPPADTEWREQLQNALQNAVMEIARLHRTIDEQNTRIHELEMLAARNMVGVQQLQDSLSSLRAALVEMVRTIEGPKHP